MTAPAEDGRKRLLMLPAAVFCWAASFTAAARFGPSLSVIPQNMATFMAAMVLTLLSAFVVYGFSCLRLHRTVYLLTGVIAAAATFHAAAPLVQRSDSINLSGEIPGEVLFLTAASAGINTIAEKLLIEPRNSLFTAVSRETADAMPEPAAIILLLALCQLTLASGIGLWIGEGIDEVSHLIPVAIVATVADIWSVSAGATAMIVVSSVINYFLLRFPLPGSNAVPYLIGLTDFLFFAIFFQAARRFSLGTGKNVVLLLSAFIVTVAAAIFFQAGLPVLPFMAVFFVAGNFGRLKLKREEIKQIMIFLLLIVTIFVVITLMKK